ncbi:MAG TPA: glycerol-3-phosphate dehydrogenase/oxidase [Pseudomonadales bacterium]|nr:glycerol-3-phosphate dehydrogenase/oxidase [Pseudomonadales bacterium]
MTLRKNLIEQHKQRVYDTLVVGGGINGAVAAASLSAKGASVALVDRGDFAGETSSHSSNLAWGGIKYLESHEYGLVWKLCRSRNHLMRSYPSTVEEIRFVTSIQKGFRFPAWFIYLGALVYWVFGRFQTKAPRYMSPKALKARDASIDISNVSGGIEYSDCYLHDNDARFVWNFIRTAIDYGCAATNYVQLVNSEFRDGMWHCSMEDRISGEQYTLKAKTLINAAGPMVDAINRTLQVTTTHRHLFSKGVHLIVDRIGEADCIKAFFASDGRLFFVIPMGPKTCIGTTDTQVEDPATSVTDEDRRFILDNVNSLLNLARPLTQDDIIAERCGVRPLALEGREGVADWVKLSRKHAIDVDTKLPLLSIFGGKLTDCINVGEEVAEYIAAMGITLETPDKCWYGEPSAQVRQEFMHQARAMKLDAMTPASSSEPLSKRLWRRYGSHALELLEMIRQDPSNAELLIENAEYLRGEVALAARLEMITKLDDFLRRRSKIALVVRREDILNAPGLMDACQLLFGEQAEQALAEYRAEK